MKRYSDIVADLDERIAGLKREGFNFDPLDDLLDQLKSHVEEIGEVEDHIEAIRSMVISPIKNELEENKKAGRFSVFGFYVGAAGLLASVASVVYSGFQNPTELVLRDEATQDQIGEISRVVLDIKRELYLRSGTLELDEGSVKVGNFDEHVVVKGKDVEITVELYGVRVYSASGKAGSHRNVAYLRFYYNGRMVSSSGVPDLVQLTNVSNIKRDSDSEFEVTEGDVITLLGKHQIRVFSILNDKATFGTLADKETAVVLSTVQAERKTSPPHQEKQ
jgi:hypothetical protein